jgi:signal transduction histidine kinase
MNLPSTVRPSLVRIVTLRLAIASTLAIVFQLAFVIARGYLDEEDLNRSYVTREARALLRGLQVGADGVLLLPQRTPKHYLGANAGAYAFRILGADGKLVASHSGKMLAELSPWRERPSRTQDLWLLDLDAERRLYLAGGVRLKFGDREVWIEVATRGDPDRVYLGIIAADVLDDVSLPMIPLAILTLVVAVFSVRRSLASLVRAAKQVGEMSPLDATRFDVSGMPREAASLAIAINGLLDNVGSLIRAQRIFIARAAHELRTPLAVMMLELGRAQGPRVDRLEADMRVMGGTVDRLLTLARLDNIEPERAVLDLGKIASELVDHLEALAAHTRHSVNLRVSEPARMPGDAIAIREALRNLIENAIRHSSPGADIEVTVGPGGSIVVEDSGPGFPSEDIAELLQPFKKGSASSEGAGLGLAIVKQVVEIHHGQIDIGRSASGGARIWLRLPGEQATPI